MVLIRMYAVRFKIKRYFQIKINLNQLKTNQRCFMNCYKTQNKNMKHVLVIKNVVLEWEYFKINNIKILNHLSNSINNQD